MCCFFEGATTKPMPFPVMTEGVKLKGVGVLEREGVNEGLVEHLKVGLFCKCVGGLVFFFGEDLTGSLSVSLE